MIAAIYEKLKFIQRVSQGEKINAGGSVVKKNGRPLSFWSFSLRLWDEHYGKYNVLCICKARCNPVVTETVQVFVWICIFWKQEIMMSGFRMLFSRLSRVLWSSLCLVPSPGVKPLSLWLSYFLFYFNSLLTHSVLLPLSHLSRLVSPVFPPVACSLITSCVFMSSVQSVSLCGVFRVLLLAPLLPTTQPPW